MSMVSTMHFHASLPGADAGVVGRFSDNLIAPTATLQPGKLRVIEPSENFVP